MIRSRSKQKTITVWLFPFFNIMLCTLGILILIGGTVTGFSLEATGIVIKNAYLTSVTGPDKKLPVYIEWNGKTLLVHPTLKSTPVTIPATVLGDNIEEFLADFEYEIRNTYFGRLLECVKIKRDRRYLVILIRPSGFDNFLLLREFLLAQGIDIGYEPLGQHWDLKATGEVC